MAVTQTQVIELYLATFNRAADSAGLDYWVASGLTIEEIAMSFFDQPETQALYPEGTTDAEFVTAIYSNTFGRTPDADGLAYWEGELSSGNMTRSVMIEAMKNGALGDDALLIANKAAVALAFAEAGLNDVTQAAAVLAGVTADAATVTAGIAAVNAIVYDNTPAQTLSLTTAQDTIVAGAGHDTINGTLDVDTDNTSSLLSTLTAFDSIDGGTGTDTFHLLVTDKDPATAQTLTAGTLAGLGFSTTNVENLEVQTTLATTLNADDTANFTNINIIGTTGNQSVTSTSATSVTVKTTGTTTIVDSNLTGAHVLATASVTGGAGAAAVGITSEALTSLTLKSVSGAVTVTDATATDSRAITMNLDTQTGSITDANATTVTLNVTGTGATATTLAAGSATSLTVHAGSTATAGTTVTNGGLAAVTTLTVDGAGLFSSDLAGAALTTIDASASTGGVTMTTSQNVATTFTGGTGADTITVGATTKTNTMGDGNDTVNMSVAVGTGGSVDAGAGVDTLVMTAANAATQSAGTTFEAGISNFEKVSLGQVALGASNTVNLANIDDIDYVISAGTATGTGKAEVSSFTTTALLSGQTLTIDGLTVTATGGDATIADVTAAIVSGATVNNAAVTGALATTTAANSSNVVTLTATAVGDAADLSAVIGAATAPTAPTVNVTTQGVTAVTGVAEVFTVAFSGFATGLDTITFDTDVTTLADGDNANLIATAVTTTGVTSGTGWTPVNNGNGTVTFTATATGARTDILTTDFLVSDVGAAGAPTISSVTTGTQGVTAVAGATEVADVTWTALTSGQSVTVAGRTVTANGADLTIAEVLAAYEAGVNTGNAVVSGTLTGYTIANKDADETTFTSTSANTSVADLTASVTNSTSPATPTMTIVDGDTTSGGGSLAITGMANNGTVELTGTVNGASSVTMSDATGTADILNIVLNGTANLVNSAATTITNVETVNITTADSTTASNPTAASTVMLNAAGTTTINVSGNHGVDFTGSTLTGLTTLDASGVVGTGSTAAAVMTAGAVTVSTVVTASNVSLTGGNGSDTLNASSITDTTKSATLSGNAGDDILVGGAGADTINGGTGEDTIYGGAGADILTGGADFDAFVLSATSDSVLASRDVITDFSANTYGQGTGGAVTTAGAVAGGNTATSATGDVLDISAITAYSLINVGVYTNAADAQTFIQNNATTNNVTVGAALDSTTGYLYMDINDDGVIDSVVELTGVTTIDAAAFVM